ESVPARSRAGLTVAAATALIIIRQTMEIFTVLAATGFDLRADGPALMTITGALAALVISVLCVAIGSRLDESVVRAAVRTFAVGFTAQVGFYGLHEAAEARILPWSAALHAATEPYGPDSEFGQRLNLALLAVAAAAAGVSWMQPRLRRVLVYATVPAAIAIAGGVFLAYRASFAPTPAAAATPAPAANLPAHGSNPPRRRAPRPAFLPARASALPPHAPRRGLGEAGFCAARRRRRSARDRRSVVRARVVRGRSRHLPLGGPRRDEYLSRDPVRQAVQAVRHDSAGRIAEPHASVR